MKPNGGRDLFGDVPARQLWLFNQVQLAEILRTSTVTIKAWERKGMPVQKAGAHGQEAEYALPDVIAWLIQHRLEQAMQPAKGDTLNDALLRKTMAEAALKELELGQRRNDLLQREEVERTWDDLLVTFRTRVLNLSRLLAQEMDEGPVRHRIESLWDQRLREALQILATHASDDHPDDRGGGAGDPSPPEKPAAGRAASKAHRQPMGRAKALREPRGRGQSRAMAQ